MIHPTTWTMAAEDANGPSGLYDQETAISPSCKGAIFIVIGEPLTNVHKDLILERISTGLNSWEDTSGLAAAVADASVDDSNGEKIIQHGTEEFHLDILVNPQLLTFKNKLRSFMLTNTKNRYIQYSGHALQGSGDWFLQDDRFTFGKFAALMKEADVTNALKQQEGGTLTIHTFAQGEWNNNAIKKHSFSKSLNVTINPEKKENTSDGVQEFINYLSGQVNVRTVKDILQSSDVVGNIRFSRPTLYIFPGCEGDSALFGISGFNLLVNGGYSRKACFWDFTRHLDRIDAMLLTHLGADNVLGINSVVDRKSMDNVHPELGFLYFNCVEKTKHSPNGDSHPENGGSHKEASLLINLMEEGDRLVENMKSIGQVSHPCAGVIANKTVAPVNLYHKVGHGTLDMYVLNPIQDSKDMKEFYSQWNKRVNDFSSTKSVIKVGGVDKPIPLPNMMSICALLVWRPSSPTEKITRILFPGNAPQNKIFEGLDLLKTLDILQHATCSEKTLHQPKGGARKTSNASILKAKPTVKKTTPPPSAIGKAEPKKIAKSPSPAKTEKVTKDIKNNKKAADKGKVNGKPEKSGTVKSSPSSTKSSTPTSTPVPAATPTSEAPKVEAVEVKKEDIKQEEVEAKKEPEITPPAAPVDSVPASGTNADKPVIESTEPNTETLPSQDLIGDLAPSDAPSSPKPAWSSPPVEEAKETPVADLLGDDAPEADTAAKDDTSMPEADQTSEPIASPEALPEPVDLSAEVPQDFNEQDLMTPEKHPTNELMPEIQPEPAKEDLIPDMPEEQTEADQDIINPVIESQQENAPPSDPSPVEMEKQQLEELGIIEAGGEKDVDTASSQEQIPKQDISQQMMEDLGIFEDEGAGEPAPGTQVCPPGAMNGQALADLGIYDESETANAPVTEPAVFGGEVPEGLPLPEEPVVCLQQQEDCFSLQQSEEEMRPTDKVDMSPQEELVTDVCSGSNQDLDENLQESRNIETETGEKDLSQKEEAIADLVQETEVNANTNFSEEAEVVTESETSTGVPSDEEGEQEIKTDIDQTAEIKQEPEQADQIDVETPETEKVCDENEADLNVSDQEDQPALAVDEVTENKEESESISVNQVEESVQKIEEDEEKHITDETPPESEISSPETHPVTMAENIEDQEEGVMGYDNDIEDPPTEQEVTPPMSPRSQDPMAEVDELQSDMPDETNVEQNSEPEVKSSQDLEKENVQDYMSDTENELVIDMKNDNLEANESQEVENAVETEEDKNQLPQELERGMTDSLDATENIPQDESDFIGQPNPFETQNLNLLGQPDLVDAEELDNSMQEQMEDVSEREEDSLNQDYPGTFAHPGVHTNGSSDPKIPEPTPFSLLDGPTSLPPLDCAQPNTNPFFGVSEENDQSKIIPGSNGAMEHHMGARPDLVEDLDVADRDSLERDMSDNFDPLKSWGSPMGLPAPTPGGASGDKKAPASKKADLNKTGRGDATKKADPKKTPLATSRTATTKKPAASATKPTRAPAEKKDNGAKTDTVAPKRTASAPIKKTRPATAPTKAASKTEVTSETRGNKRPATASSATKIEKPKPLAPVVPCYMDLTYVPNHADPHYVDLDFFRRVRARYYVLSALNPSPSIFNALLEAKQTWDNPELEVTIIPTYDTDALRQWMNLHRDDLSQHKIDVAPSASRCTIQLQDHETSCSAYRLEF